MDSVLAHLAVFKRLEEVAYVTMHSALKKALFMLVLMGECRECSVGLA